MGVHTRKRRLNEIPHLCKDTHRTFSTHGDFHLCDEDRLISAAKEIREGTQFDGCQVHCICQSEAHDMKAFLQVHEPDVADKFYFSWLIFPQHKDTTHDQP